MSERSAPLTRGIYGIVDTAVTRDPIALLEAMLRGGVRVAQLRAKAGVDRALVRAMVAAARPIGARIVVNDDLEAALEADGWHGGQEDLAGLDLGVVRLRLGGRLLGISCGTPTEAMLAEAAGADYVGTGPFAATATKSDAGEAIGVAGIGAVVAAVRIPVVAIGGIDAENVGDAARSGAHMAAVVSAIARAVDPQAAVEALARAWDSAAP